MLPEEGAEAMLQAADVFSGTRSVARVFYERGWQVDCIDILDGTDVLTWEPKRQYDFGWFSPPCQAFSVAGFAHGHFKEGQPQTDTARMGLVLMNRTLQLVRTGVFKWWAIENPRGLMRKFMPADLPRVTVTYCQYGDTRMKPTDLWTNIPADWFLPACRPRAPCHQSAPRGTRHVGTTQGQSGAAERGKVPRGLVESVARWVESQ